MKYFSLLRFLFLLLPSVSLQAQEMAYRFGYVFKKSLLENKGKLFIINKANANRRDTVGFFGRKADGLTYIFKDVTDETKSYSSRTILNRLKGVVTSRNKDSLYIISIFLSGSN